MNKAGPVPRGAQNCFKAYDIRGEVPGELDGELAYRIGLAFASEFSPGRTCVGGDVRTTTPQIKERLSAGLADGGSDVADLGTCGTEEIYFATFDQGFDAGLMVTASHNPAQFNGMKMVGRLARPIHSDNGLLNVRDRALNGNFGQAGKTGAVTSASFRERYVDHLMGYVRAQVLKPLRIVVNGGNGSAGPVLDMLESRLPFGFVKINHEMDGTFPNGVPNPLLPENREQTSHAVTAHKADLGLAWDGDFDRCFFFDEKGGFVEGYYIVGLLAGHFLARSGGGKIVHDPRLYWNTEDVAGKLGGMAVKSRTGHAFVKESMRLENAVYGGEMSAHHYFRDFAYCDSGMIAWLVVAEILSATGKPLSELVGDMCARYPASGEINRKAGDPNAAMDAVRRKYEAGAVGLDFTDGLGMDMGGWRFNLRCSNTEPLIRLNVESRGDRGLMEEKTGEILGILADFT